MASRPLHILLIDPVYGRHTPYWYMPLGAGLLASYVLSRFGQEVRIDIEREVDRILAALAATRYDIVASSNYVWNTALSYECLRRAKESNSATITIQGGPHFDDAESAAAWAFLKHRPLLDYYVIGEGERTFAAIIEAVLGGSLDALPGAGLGYLRDGQLCHGGAPERLKDLDQVPSPYLSGLLDRFLDRGFTPIVETNRGCPFSCTFCNWGSATVAKIHQFSFDRVCEELSYIARRAAGMTISPSRTPTSVSLAATAPSPRTSRSSGIHMAIRLRSTSGTQRTRADGLWKLRKSSARKSASCSRSSR